MCHFHICSNFYRCFLFKISPTLSHCWRLWLIVLLLIRLLWGSVISPFVTVHLSCHFVRLLRDSSHGKWTDRREALKKPHLTNFTLSGNHNLLFSGTIQALEFFLDNLCHGMRQSPDPETFLTGGALIPLFQCWWIKTRRSILGSDDFMTDREINKWLLNGLTFVSNWIQKFYLFLI